MAKRLQDKIKNFRGTKQAARQATEDWMAGTTAGAVTRNNCNKRLPTFQLEPSVSGLKKTRVERNTREKKKPPSVASTSVQLTESILQVSPVARPSAGRAEATVDQLAEAAEVDDDCGYNDDDEIRQFDQLPASENEEDDDGILQIVTPRGKTSRELILDPTEVQLSVQQYETVIADYKERLVRAERQLRAISKTQLADKFMENEVRKYVKESLWKRCKFITCQETMDDCMDEVAGHFAIDGIKIDHWKNTYAHAVRDAINNRRNNTAQDLKREITGE